MHSVNVNSPFLHPSSPESNMHAGNVLGSHL